MCFEGWGRGMVKASAAQKRAVQALSVEVFGSRSAAVEIAGRALSIHRGFTSEAARRLIVALRQVEADRPADKVTGLLAALGVVEVEPTVTEERSEGRQVSKNSKLGPDGRPWVEWATEQLGMVKEPELRSCPKCKGTGTVQKLGGGSKRHSVSAVCEGVMGYKGSGIATLSAATADPPLSRLVRVADLLGVDSIDEASRWLRQLHEAIASDRKEA